MKDDMDNLDELDDLEDIGLLDSDDVFTEGKSKKPNLFDEVSDLDLDDEDDIDADLDIDVDSDDENDDDDDATATNTKEAVVEEEDDDDDDDASYILNDYGTSEIEETELIIDDMGEFEKDDYWVDDEEGYEGLDINDLA